MISDLFQFSFQFCPQSSRKLFRSFNRGMMGSDLGFRKIALAAGHTGGGKAGVSGPSCSPGGEGHHLGTRGGLVVVEVDLWYNWEVELPELAYRLDVDEMEDGGFQGHHLGFWQLEVGTSSYREREPQKKTKFQETSATQMHWRRL